MNRITLRHQLVREGLYSILQAPSMRDISMVGPSDGVCELRIRESDTRTSAFGYENMNDLSHDYEAIMSLMAMFIED